MATAGRLVPSRGTILLLILLCAVEINGSEASQLVPFNPNDDAVRRIVSAALWHYNEHSGKPFFLVLRAVYRASQVSSDSDKIIWYFSLVVDQHQGGSLRWRFAECLIFTGLEIHFLDPPDL
ncbi:hypothetical protein AXF42_Ash019132 [Apostasia shenzhenica]|uniref:Cystatin domain-containing protein n=1 Tax=Apostasia shenzhenica TaxID=1088818 RepID=A0A2I0AAG7_9ASPA|nr:hypothetical protein AXF42_Ash019132 [Apostasia shenzhenica]